MTSHFIKSTRRAAASLSLALCLFAGTVPARADDIPKFSDPAVAAYCQKFSDVTDELITAIKAKDETKMNAAMAKMKAVQEQAGDIATKIKPEEVDAYTKYLDSLSARIDKAN